MEIAVGFNSIMTTTHPPNVNLPSSGQQITDWLSARKVSVAGGNRAQDSLVRDTTAGWKKTYWQKKLLAKVCILDLSFTLKTWNKHRTDKSNVIDMVSKSEV